MEVHFTPEQEAQIALLARRSGTEPEHVVKYAVLRRLQDEVPPKPAAPALPVLHLGPMGELHRRYLYDGDPE